MSQMLNECRPTCLLQIVYLYVSFYLFFCCFVSVSFAVTCNCLHVFVCLCFVKIDVRGFSEMVEKCQKWSDNITQQIDLAFNIFFMVYFFIRVSIFNYQCNGIWKDSSDRSSDWEFTLLLT